MIEIQSSCSFPPVLASSHENEAFPKKSFSPPPPISLLLPHRVLLQLEKKHPPSSSHTSEEAKKQQMRGKEQRLCLCGNDSERRGGRGAFFRGVARQAGTRRSLFGTRGKIDWVCTVCTQPAAERRNTPWVESLEF